MVKVPVGFYIYNLLTISHACMHVHFTFAEGKEGSKCCSGKEKPFKRKKRTSFTIAQIRELENKFDQQKYLTRIDRHLLARSLGLTEKHVKTWYQNRRTKWKRSCTEQDWSKQRESAATVMYNQHVQLKRSSSSHDRAL